MRFSFALIALTLGLTGTILARNEVPPQVPQYPAAEATRQVEHIEYAHPEIKESKDICSRDQSSEVCMGRSAAKANGQDLAPKRHQEVPKRSRSDKNMRTIGGSRRKLQTKNTSVTRVVLRRQLTARSILYYRRRRYAEALSELRWQAILDKKEYLGRMIQKWGHGYELKAGNYRIELRRTFVPWI